MMEASALVAAVSHGVAAAAFAGFAGLLLASRQVRERQRVMLAACLLTALWAAAAALHGSHILAIDRVQLVQLLEVLEVSRTAAWMVFLVLLLAPAGLPTRRSLIVAAVLAAVQLLAAELSPTSLAVTGPPEEPQADLATDLAGVAAIAARLLLAVLGILLVEQLYRSTPPRERWGIKFACLGLGTLFVYDFYLYSDALLFRRIQPEIWAARGFVDALCVPLLAITAARNPGWKLGLALSRQMMLRSAALVGCAVYLLAMAAGGWYLRSVGGAWGPVMQLACLVGAALLLAGVLFSGTARARLRVFISKHFYQTHFDYRDEWQRFTQALSEGGTAPGERAVQAIAALVESPAGALWIGRDGIFEPAARWMLPPQQGTEPASSPFCQLLGERQWVVDAGRHQPGAAQMDTPLPAWLHGIPGLWLVVPLSLHGELFGFVALARPRTAVALNWEVFDLLRLAVARQFESFNRMSTFVMHDLKNLLSQHSLLLANAERHKDNPAFQEDMLDTLAHSVQKMTGLLQRLSRLTVAGDAGATAAALSSAPILLAAVVRRAAQAYATARPQPALDIADDTLAALADGPRLERTLAHLLQNAVEATPPDGSIVLSLHRAGDGAVIEVRDTGSGIGEAFLRDGLFRPFATTKAAGMGIGVYESREYVRELGGRLEVASRPGAGTTFRIVLPLQHHGMTPYGGRYAEA